MTSMDVKETNSLNIMVIQAHALTNTQAHTNEATDIQAVQPNCGKPTPQLFPT